MSTARENRLQRDRERHRARSAATLAEARQGRRLCPRAYGRSGRCGEIIEHRVLAGGRVEVVCPRCDRFEAGVCRDCPAPVHGTPRRAIRCASCRLAARRAIRLRYRAAHLEEERKRSRVRGQRERETRTAYKRAWRERFPLKAMMQNRRRRLRREAA